MRVIRSLQYWAKIAIDCQDGVNLSGIVHSFSECMSDLAHHGVVNTAERNKHPIAVLFASKIASLTECDSLVSFSQAYSECQNLVGKVVE